MPKGPGAQLAGSGTQSNLKQQFDRMPLLFWAPNKAGAKKRSVAQRTKNTRKKLLRDMDRKLKPVELCSHTLAHKRSNELPRSVVHHNSRARLAVYELYPARQGRAEDVMTASLRSRTQSLLAVHISELDRKLVTATEGTSCLGCSAALFVSQLRRNSVSLPDERETVTEHISYFSTFSLIRQDQTLQARPC
ncbi:MAG: hypothetical protein FRX49_09245 [Trebouxia sp. A1-2]|nr:MAG: hypothetical protein FRX49_09245 [Trebouxia sp. A1-2]